MWLIHFPDCCVCIIIYLTRWIVYLRSSSYQKVSYFAKKREHGVAGSDHINHAVEDVDENLLVLDTDADTFGSHCRLASESGKFVYTDAVVVSVFPPVSSCCSPSPVAVGA